MAASISLSLHSSSSSCMLCFSPFRSYSPAHCTKLLSGSRYVLRQRFLHRRQKCFLPLRANRPKVLVQQSSFDSNLPSIETLHTDGDLTNAAKEGSDVAVKDWLLKLLVVAVVMAGVFTVFSIMKLNTSGTTVKEAGVHYRLSFFGRVIQIEEAFPGWGYFWLLMAAGFGLFVSEEALNVWVGATIARTLNFNGTWTDFITSVSANSGNISSTLFWIYWGVCISDMIPFYTGCYAVRTKAGKTLRKMVGVNEKTLTGIIQTVQRYGNLIGFVERFSVGVRNPTSFLAGAMGVCPEKFFTGVCLGALLTVPLQMGLGFLFRERPMTALAGVAAVVGIWTVIPYALAGAASIIYIIRKRVTQGHSPEPVSEN